MDLKLRKIRKDFPILEREGKKKVVYADNACMSLRPRQVIDKISEYYEEFPGCGGRSSHRISQKVDEEVMNARNLTRKFFNVKNKGSDAGDVIFTKNTTEAINIVANCFPFKKGDEILRTDKEHNSNLVPWIKRSEGSFGKGSMRFGKGGVKNVVVNSGADNILDMEDFKKKISRKTKLVTINQVSNLDGVRNDLKKIVKLSHDHGAKVLVDGAQGAPHQGFDFKKSGADFYACSSHKMIGPSGVGVLIAKKNILNEMDSFISGGETVYDSTYSSYKEEESPSRFEAGLQNYPGIIGFGEALRYLKKIGFSYVQKRDARLNKILTENLLGIRHLNLIGPEDYKLRSGIFNFFSESIDAHEIAQMLDKGFGVMARSGAHCQHAWFNKKNIRGSLRLSMYFYNSDEEAETVSESVSKIFKLRQSL